MSPSKPPAAAPSAAANAATRPPSRAGIWQDHHLYSFASSLGRALRKPGATLLTVAVMALAVALPLGLWEGLANVQHFAGNVQASREIALFLKPSVSVGQAQALAVQLRARPDVAGVVVRTPDEGLAELREQGRLGEGAGVLESNPLPSLLQVTPKTDEAPLAAALEALPEADQVQHDAQWRQRLDGWLAFGTRLATVLAVLFGLGALLVVGNTVRLDIQSRRDEIGVLQLLGATDGFIRRPFLYLGAWYGLASGVLAVVLVAIAGLALRPPLTALAQSYGSSFALAGPPPLHLLAVVAASTFVGWLGAGLVTGHFLRQTRPTET